MHSLRLATLVLASALVAHADPWHHLSNPSIGELAPHFASPPAEYSSQVTWGWGGRITREVIARDLDHLLSLNIHAAWVEPGRDPDAPYLSPAYFRNVKIAVEEAKKRHMFLWFDDDGGYPSGFAGGKFTELRPDLRMKALAEPEEVPVAAGQTFTRPVEPQTICAVARNLDTGATELLTPHDGKVSWTAPATGRWVVGLAHWVYRSGPTRSANNKSGQKDTEHSLMDYLSPAANQLFIQWTFDQYRQAVGDEFGKTFLGFRGDEAAFGFNPWTPDFPAEFQQRKGYDIRPYLPEIARIQIGRFRPFAPLPIVHADTDTAHRVYADYCDVWSDLFGENFFSADAKWCAAHGLALQHHIEHEEILPQLAIADGDYFKCMRDVQVPGIDVIWHQMWHDVVADFPKLASSAAHLNGHPQAMSESFAAMGGRYPTPNLEEASWILHHQMVLGITHFEYMFMPASTPRPAGATFRPRRDFKAPSFAGVRGAAPAGYRYLNDAKFPALALAINRATYLLAQGRPAAQIGVFIPSSSFWFGDTAVNQSFLAIVHSLLEHQRDLDFVDDASLAHTLKVHGTTLVNRSGQGYGAIIVPPAVAMSKAALDTLHAFAAAGGRVIFLGHTPRLVMDRNFLTAQPPSDLSWATLEPSTEITPAVLAALPAPDLALTHEMPGLKYNHRRLKDADLYFLFNEGDAPVNQTVQLAASPGESRVQEWDAETGAIAPIPLARVANGRASVPVKLGSWATELIVLRR